MQFTANNISLNPVKYEETAAGLILFLIRVEGFGQQRTQTDTPAPRWVDSVFKSSRRPKDRTIMIVRMSGIDADEKSHFMKRRSEEAIRKIQYRRHMSLPGRAAQAGELHQSNPGDCKNSLNVSIDAENGVGMRMDTCYGLPRQMMMGAVMIPH